MSTRIGRYKKLNERLGQGSYKTVTRAIDEEEGKEVAFNEVRIRDYEEETHTTSSFSKEIALLKNIDHPYIIKIFDYWFTEEDFVFVTELMTGGTLRDYISRGGPLNTKLIKKWGKQVFEGLNYLHTRDPPIIHRDIKNENIFVNASQGDIKIGDLGIAREKKHKHYTMVGTPNFMAREMFESDGYCEKVDIYACGMALLEMATARTPYTELGDSSQIFRNVLRGVLPACLKFVEDNCLRSLIMGCLVPQTSRASAAQCLEHHFFDSESACNGDCIAPDCVTVCPLVEPVQGMELSLVAFDEPVITFQILLTDSSRFIKFDYHLVNDTLEKVSAELISESIISAESIDTFVGLLQAGIERVIQKDEAGHIKDGIIELDSADLTGALPQQRKEKFGNATLEVMDEIEREMLFMGHRKGDEKGSAAQGAPAQSVPAAAVSSPVSAPSAGAAPASAASAPVLATAAVEPENEKQFYECIAQNRTGSAEALSSCLSQTGTSCSSVGGSAGPIAAAMSALTISDNAQAKDEVPADDLSLSQGYDLYKTKYKQNFPIAQFALDAAAITKRSEDTAKSWIKTLRDDDLETVFDLKLLVYEDWENLPLTVFSSRAMQNMLYGLGNIPLKEKQLPMNLALRDYEHSLSIKEFLQCVCDEIHRPELAANWEIKLMAQDIQTAGELKSLHPDDWNRLGLSVLAYRILKNVIFRKGKITLK